jgi:HEAT repeat protein
MPALPLNVAALVEQMPDTDKEIQTKQEAAKPATSPERADPPKPKPNRWGAASKFTGPDPVVAEKIFNEILSGGRESILELLRLVRDPSDNDYQNYKAGYVLHGLVLQAGRPGQEIPPRILTEALASQLSSEHHSTAAKGFFIRELRVLGGQEVVSILGKLLLDAQLCEDAAQALLTIRDGAAAQFRSALKDAKGANRVTVIQALGVLQDTAAAASLKTALNDEDRDVRRSAAWALANLGEASVAAALLQSADDVQGWERTQATKACLLLAERLAASGKNPQAVQIYTHLRDTRKDPKERHVRQAAERALAALPPL